MAKAKKQPTKNSTTAQTVPVTPLPPTPAEYLIVQRLDGRTYVYYESAAHHAAAEHDRKADGCTCIAVNLLAHECDMSVYADRTYMVFRLEKNWLMY